MICSPIYFCIKQFSIFIYFHIHVFTMSLFGPKSIKGKTSFQAVLPKRHVALIFFVNTFILDSLSK